VRPDVGGISGTASDSGDSSAGLDRVQVSFEDLATHQWWDGGAWSNNEVFLPATGTSSWHRAIPSLTDGRQYRVRSLALDKAGNWQWGATATTVTADGTAPETTLDASGPTGLTKSRAASFSFSSEANATFACKLGSDSWRPCASPKTYTGLADGAHTFSVRATDPAGNTDATATTRSWTVDATPPQTTLDASGPSGRTKNTSASFRFSSEANAKFECKLDSGPWAACASPKVLSGLSNGSHTFRVRAIDAAGNTDASPATRN